MDSNEKLAYERALKREAINNAVDMNISAMKQRTAELYRQRENDQMNKLMGIYKSKYPDVSDDYIKFAISNGRNYNINPNKLLLDSDLYQKFEDDPELLQESINKEFENDQVFGDYDYSLNDDDL